MTFSFESVLASKDGAFPKFFAAPMVDLSHLAFRQLCRKYGAQVCYTPMFHASMFATNPGYRAENFTTCSQDRPLVVQFCANDHEKFIQAAKLVQDECDAVDLNLGCPQVIAKRGNYGAYLQDDWNLIRKIISEASAHLKVPVSCKIRILQDPIRTVEYVRMIENTGCKLVAVHARTREQKGHATGLADWKIIEEIANSVSIPVVANGNILCYDDVTRCLECTGANGVMAAESLLQNPALFSNKNPAVWEMAEEYLDLCEMYPVSTRIIRTVLFRMWANCLPRYKDLQLTLSESNDMSTFRSLCSQLRDRCVFDMDTAYKQQENNSNAWERPFWLCHSRPRVNLNSTELSKSSSTNESGSDLEEYDNKDLRKQNRCMRIIEGKKLKRQMQKEKRRNRKILEEGTENETKMRSDHVSKRIVKQMEKERLAAAMKSDDTPCVCIDLGFSHLMNDKELDKLGAQLRRIYGSNRSSLQPLCLYFTNFSEDGALYKACMSKNDGFDKYMIKMRGCSHVDLFPLDDLIYLTPDSTNVLVHLDSSKVYIIGGLVDETVHKNCSLNVAEQSGLNTARLPINEHLVRADKGHFCQVLAVNQVFDILLKYYATGDWIQSLLQGIPPTSGFVAPSNDMAR